MIVPNLILYYYNVFYYNIQMTAQCKLFQYAKGVTPMLLWVNNFSTTLNRATFLIYCRVDTQHYRPLQSTTQIFTKSPSISFKIINLNTNESFLLQSQQWTPKSNISILTHSPYGSITLTATLLSEAGGQGGILQISVLSLTNYKQFNSFRRKSKTLQQLTRKIQFNLDHHIKIMIGEKQMHFALQENSSERYFVQGRSAMVVLEEVIMVGDVKEITEIQSQLINLEPIYDTMKTFCYRMKFICNFEVCFLLEFINNVNLSQNHIVAIRVLQCRGNKEQNQPQIIIGTEKNIHFDQVSKIKPIHQSYYDTEYLHLTKNLQTVSQNNQNVYQHLDKLSKSFLSKSIFNQQKQQSKYQCLRNQNIIDFTNANYLIFKSKNYQFSIPIVYLLQGLNVSFTANITIKYLVQFSTSPIPLPTTKSIYQLHILQLHNLSTLVPHIRDQLTLTIINEHTIYNIPFQHTKEVLFSKEQLLQLQIRNQLTTHTPHFQCKSKDFIITSSTLNLNYVLELTSSQAVYFRLRAGEQTIGQGTLNNNGYISVGNALLRVSLNQVKQVNQSLHSYYVFRHKITAEEQSEKQYRVQLKIKEKIIKGKLRVGSTLMELEEGYFAQEQEVEIGLSVGNVVKKIIIGGNGGGGIWLKVEAEQYKGITIEMYDEGRMQYCFEVYHMKSQLLDLKDSSYIINIPKTLWSRNKTNENIHFSTLMSRMNNNCSQQTIEYGDITQHILNHHNYKDGFCVRRGNEMQYSKAIKALKVKCTVNDNEILCNNESQWYLGVLANCYFFVKILFDPFEDKKSKSKGSSRTHSAARSDRSDLHRVDPFAKTIRNADLHQLKKKRNELILQGKQLTARKVHREQKIIQLKRKLDQIQQQIANCKVNNNTNKKIMKVQTLKEKRKLFNQICQCGSANPPYKGYCKECLVKLKNRYDVYLKQFQGAAMEYEERIEEEQTQKEEVRALKEKLKPSYERQGENGEHISSEMVFLRNTVQDLKAKLFQLKETRTNIQYTSLWQINKIEQAIRKEDQQIYQSSQLMQELKMKIKKIKQCK